MDIRDLETIMVSYGVVLRAIPEKVRGIYEKRHIDKYPNGVIKYLDDFKREMLVVETIPKNAGKFIFECVPNTSSVVQFKGKKYYNSIEDAVEDLLKSK